MIIAEVSLFPLGTGTPSVSEYVKVALRELEASGLSCTPGPMGTTVEAETTKEAYAAIARAQAAVFELGAGRAYTVIKMDERKDMKSRSVGDMMDSVRERNSQLIGGQRSRPATPARIRNRYGTDSKLALVFATRLTDRTRAGTTIAGSAGGAAVEALDEQRRVQGGT